MSQRDSGYARKENDLYETPRWVTEALVPHLKRVKTIHEPAAGTGKIVDVLIDYGYAVSSGDLSAGDDFLKCERLDCDAVVTNPPYGMAQEFIERALDLTDPSGMVAMLLRTDYDHAATRNHLFDRSSAFAKKLVLTKRIKWFENTKGSPSFNHAWFIWDWQHEGPPILAYTH